MTTDKKNHDAENLANYAGINDRIFFTCGDCGHTGALSPSNLLKRFGDLTDWSPMAEKMVCKKCNSRGGYFTANKLGD